MICEQTEDAELPVSHLSILRARSAHRPGREVKMPTASNTKPFLLSCLSMSRLCMEAASTAEVLHQAAVLPEEQQGMAETGYKLETTLGL